MPLTADDKSAGPLYRRIQKVLRERIAQGDWSCGQALPNRSQLCAEFGTTRVTLDKAVQELVREGLLRSARGSGTYVAPPGGTGRGTVSRALRVGVILGTSTPPADDEDVETDNTYLGPLFNGIRDGLGGGEAVETLHAHIEHGDYAPFFRDSSLDGLILVTPTLGELPRLRRLRDQKIPFVAVGISSSAASDSDMCCVDTDNRQGAYDAVSHLLGLGHRRIAIVNLAMSHSNHHDRLEGYRQALTAAGVAISPSDLVLYPAYQAAEFEPRIQEWLTRSRAAGDLPTAVFACDFVMTLTLLRVLRRQGLRVPEDISVVGFDDPLSAGHLTPPLTVVRQPIYRLGRRAAQRLVHALQTGSGADLLAGAEILPTELIIRESTAPPTPRTVSTS